MAYPTKEMETFKNGRQNRFATTDDVKQIFEEESKIQLDWFFEIYLRQPELPVLESRVQNNTIFLSWKTPNNLPFPMPVEVKMGDKLKRIDLENGKTGFGWDFSKMTYDPNGWILKK